jgi:hypothetical protein
VWDACAAITGGLDSPIRHGRLCRRPRTPGLSRPGAASCRQLRPSGNTTSTEVSPTAATTAVVLASKSPSLLQPHLIAGSKIDAACPTTRYPAELATPRRPIEAHPAKSRGAKPPNPDRQKATPGGHQRPNPALIRSTARPPAGLRRVSSLGCGPRRRCARPISLRTTTARAGCSAPQAH